MTLTSLPEPDLDAAFNLVMRMLPIPGLSGHETAIMQFIKAELVAAGAEPASLVHDDAHTKSPLGGELGNLIFHLPGTIPGEHRVLMAHTDTVPVCIGSKPVREGDVVKSGDPATGLGADDRSGAATLLTTAIEILRRKLPHPPVTFVWLVQEEVGLFGARHGDLAQWGQPKLAFNWDGGAAAKATVGATGAYRLLIKITGVASHAGVHPENGVSATTIAGLAIARLYRDGWLGLIERDGQRATSNIGYLHGGEATNVVTPYLEIKAEARSHNAELRAKIVAAYEQAFEEAAAEVHNVAGVRGQVAVEKRLDYDSFKLADDEPCVLAAEAAIRSIGLDPIRVISNGGLDANWTSARGLPTVTMGSGQDSPHTVNEKLHLPEFFAACRIALRLATGSESPAASV